MKQYTDLQKLVDDKKKYEAADAAFDRYFKAGGYQYGSEETQDARGWFRAGFIQNEAQANRMAEVRRLLGYVEAGGGDTVTMFQDDATMTFHIKVGKAEYFDKSFTAALDAAIAGTPKEF